MLSMEQGPAIKTSSGPPIWTPPYIDHRLLVRCFYWSAEETPRKGRSLCFSVSMGISPSGRDCAANLDCSATGPFVPHHPKGKPKGKQTPHPQQAAAEDGCLDICKFCGNQCYRTTTAAVTVLLSSHASMIRFT